MNKNNIVKIETNIEVLKKLLDEARSTAEQLGEKINAINEFTLEVDFEHIQQKLDE